MKTSFNAAILLSIFFIITACNVLTPALSSPTIQEVVTPTQISDEEAIRAALVAHLGANPNDLNIVINQNMGTHATGGVENGYFLAAKINWQWLIVVDGQGALDCSATAQYDFPSSMVPECSAPPPPTTDDDALRAALAAHLGANPNDLTIVIDQNTGTHARGGVDNGYFLAAGQAMPDCTLVAQYGFPPSMVPECQGANFEFLIT